MAKFKFLSMTIIFSLILISSTACTKEKNVADEKTPGIENSPALQIAANDASLPTISYIETVGKAPKGKSVDFTWKVGTKTNSFSEISKGKVVLLNFWGTWCGPCRMEIPDLIEINNELPSKDFVLVGIPLERGRTLDDNKNSVQGFVKAKNISYMNILPTSSELLDHYGGIQGVPTTFIINRKGEIIEKVVGPRSKTEFLRLIEKAKNS